MPEETPYKDRQAADFGDTQEPFALFEAWFADADEARAERPQRHVAGNRRPDRHAERAVPS